jgi:hypothetical protein
MGLKKTRCDGVASVVVRLKKTRYDGVASVVVGVKKTRCDGVASVIVGLTSAMTVNVDEDLFRGRGYASGSCVEEEHPMKSNSYCRNVCSSMGSRKEA